MKSMIQLATKKIIYLKQFESVIFISIICGLLSFIENSIPRPFVFIKLGFGFIPVLLVYNKLRPYYLLLLLLLKSVITGFFSGTLFSYIGLLSFFSVIAVFIGLLFVLLCLKLHLHFSLIAISIFTSFLSNSSQLLLYAFTIVKSFALLKLIVPISLISIATGLITGIIAMKIQTKYLEIVIDEK